MLLISCTVLLGFMAFERIFVNVDARVGLRPFEPGRGGAASLAKAKKSIQ